MLKPEMTTQFRRDFKRSMKRGCNMQLLQSVIECLAREEPLSAKHRDHPLTGNYRHYRECHIQPDWLLVYRVEQDRLVLVLARTGAHADLFDE